MPSWAWIWRYVGLVLYGHKSRRAGVSRVYRAVLFGGTHVKKQASRETPQRIPLWALLPILVSVSSITVYVSPAIVPPANPSDGVAAVAGGFQERAGKAWRSSVSRSIWRGPALVRQE
jgi:hypothetical protein